MEKKSNTQIVVGGILKGLKYTFIGIGVLILLTLAFPLIQTAIAFWIFK